MSIDNLAVQQRFLASVQAGDMTTLRTLLHPDFEMRQTALLPYGGHYRGPDGFIVFLQTFMAMLDIEALEGTGSFVAESGAIVGEILIRVTLKETGAKMDTTILEKWEFADGKVVRITPHYFDPTFR